jgi:hypothetical protein
VGFLLEKLMTLRIYTEDGEPVSQPNYPNSVFASIQKWIYELDEKKTDRSDIQVALNDLFVDTLMLVTLLPSRSNKEED